jgi:DNA-binding MarR family transcriptional regulator
VERDHVQYVIEQWRREAPGLDRTGFAVVGRISRLAQLLEAELEPVFARHGLSAGEFDVLAALRRAGHPYRLTPTEISRALLITSGGLTKRLAALTADGLVVREPDPSDGRSTAVRLTAAGRKRLDAALAAHSANEERILGSLSRRDQRALAQLLERLAVGLGDEAEPPARRRRL